MTTLLVLAFLVPGLPVADQVDPQHLSPRAEVRLIRELVEEQVAVLAVEAAVAERERVRAAREAEQVSRASVWSRLADCESGDRDVPGSARWHLGGTDARAEPRPPWGNGLFYGGLQFSLESWAWAAELGGHSVDPNPANNSPTQQVAVAETLLAQQGWGAWPSCSSLLGLG